MTVVFYSFTADAPGHYERRWLRSIRSLRAHDGTTPVLVCLYGAEVGLWLLLGRVPGATHAPYDVAEVAQSDEYLIPGLDPVAVHYFSAHEAAFERFLAQGR